MGESLAQRIYTLAVSQGRDPALYGTGGAPDTVEGRFDMIVLHVSLVLRRLKRQGGASALAQEIFDQLFVDMECALREMGAGDTSVGYKIKEMARAFYGRLRAYEKALDADSEELLQAALRRNIFPDAQVDARILDKLSAYVCACASFLEDCDMDSIRFPSAKRFLQAG